MKFIQPVIFNASFTCPHCNVAARQDWWFRTWDGHQENNNEDNHPLRVATCHHCKVGSVWVGDKLVYPETVIAPLPNPEMPEPVHRLYMEAALIHNKSPRGAAALLRLSIQVLTKELGEPGENINNDIASLVQKGLPEIVQQSLDIVRVTGNDSVHPGQIDTDDPETVGHLFALVNIIVEYMIALPNQVSGLYNALPASKLKGITDRDKK